MIPMQALHFLRIGNSEMPVVGFPMDVLVYPTCYPIVHQTNRSRLVASRIGRPDDPVVKIIDNEIAVIL